MKEKVKATVHPHHGEPFEAIVLRERSKPRHEYEIRYFAVNGRWETTWLSASQIEIHPVDSRTDAK